MRKQIEEADLRKKAETNVFAEFLSKVMPNGQASKVPPTPPPTPQKMRRGPQTDVTSASITTPRPTEEFKYEPPKQEPVEDDNEEDD